MKVILVDQRHGHTRTIVFNGWLKGLLTLCLLGAPVAMGYVPKAFASVGTEVQLMIRGKGHPAKVAKTPFIEQRYVRKITK